MRYEANPVEVDAFTIEKVGDVDENGKRMLDCSEGRRFFATPEMMSRMTPAPGDYIVIQSDDYVYLNPKQVFERKYRPIGPKT
jgi:hypothetical protein